MPNYILRRKVNLLRNVPDWDTVLDPFKGKATVVDRGGEAMILVIADETVVQEIVGQNEGIMYFAEVFHQPPDPRPVLVSNK